MRRLKRLEYAVSLSVVHWRMREKGWTFAPCPSAAVLRVAC
jgi:glutathionyl-hydroquinone reductase